jgi:hypothetical protein
MANIKDSRLYMETKFRQDLQKYSDEEDDRFHYTIKELTKIKNFSKIASKILSKLIKTKYI